MLLGYSCFNISPYTNSEMTVGKAAGVDRDAVISVRWVWMC